MAFDDENPAEPIPEPAMALMEATKAVYKIGRPTKFRPEMCNTVIELGKQGFSKAQMASALCIDRDTFKDWEAHNKAFSASVKEAITHALSWWETKGQDFTWVTGGRWSPLSYIFQMKNRFPDDWRDRSEVKQISDGSNPMLALATELAKQLVKEKRKQPKAIDVQSVKVEALH